MYHGPHGWTAPRRVEELFELPEGTVPARGRLRHPAREAGAALGKEVFGRAEGGQVDDAVHSPQLVAGLAHPPLHLQRIREA
jgi:hypothetical protein